MLASFVLASMSILANGGVQTNFVGRIENFEQDFDAVCRRLGIDEQGARAVALERYHVGYRPVTDLVEGALGLDEVYPWNPSDVAQGQVAGHWRAEYTAKVRGELGRAWGEGPRGQNSKKKA
jgi:hypothetical protein